MVIKLNETTSIKKFMIKYFDPQMAPVTKIRIEMALNIMKFLERKPNERFQKN